MQTKKPAQREQLLKHAFRLFARKGYRATTMAQIAATAGMTVANIYVYFPSKMHLFYAVYRPLQEEQLQALKAELDTLPVGEARIRRLFTALWQDMPAAHNGFANNLMQALAEERGKADSELLTWVETITTDLLRDALPPARRHLAADDRLAHLAWMAFDGFAINQRLGDVRDTGGIVDLICDLLLGRAVDTTAAAAE